MQMFRQKYQVEECLVRIREVLESGWLRGGPHRYLLEDSLARYLDVTDGVVFLNSVESGFILAFQFAKLAPGTKVAVSPFAPRPVMSALRKRQLIPHFCDIEGPSLSMSLESVERALDSGVTTVVWSHTSGAISDSFEDFILRQTLGILPQARATLIEDCTEAFGATYLNAEKVGTYPLSINVHGLNGLGAISCQGKAEELRRLAGCDSEGSDLTGSDVMASIWASQVEQVSQDIKERRSLYAWYKHYFQNTAVRVLRHDPSSTFHSMVIATPHRDAVQKALKNARVTSFALVPHYEFPEFKQYYTRGQCPTSEKMSPELLALPTYPGRSQEDLSRTAETILKAIDSLQVTSMAVSSLV
jgi:UDP-2-acetamido-2-deoxy-ribo-hexuluronate aminotransferase